MDDKQFEFLTKFLATPSPSGREQAVQQLWGEYVRDAVDYLGVDVYHNQVAVLNGTTDTKILLAGHVDEIGLMVHYIDDEGFLYCKPAGGHDLLVLRGQRVTLLGPKETLVGVIGRKAAHLQDSSGENEKPKLHEMPIDIGAQNKDDAQTLAPVGTRVVVGEPFATMAHNMATSRCFDDKIGAFIVAEVLRTLSAASSRPRVTVLGLASTQEECGLWGAGPAAYALRPSAAIAVDVTHATDTPGLSKPQHGEVFLGRGPTLDAGVVPSQVLFDLLWTCSQTHQIPCQVEVSGSHTGTDADPMAVQRGGIPVMVVGIPLRYMHTAVEVADLRDVDTTIKFLCTWLSELDPASLPTSSLSVQPAAP